MASLGIMESWSNWATIGNTLGGFSTAIVLAITVGAIFRQRGNAAREDAARLTVWVAEVFSRSGGDEPESEGVVVMNGTNSTVRDVDIKLGSRARETGAGTAMTKYTVDENTPGVRLSVVPPGTFFIPLGQSTTETVGIGSVDGAPSPWKQILPVQADQGMLTVQMPNDAIDRRATQPDPLVHECEVRPFTPKKGGDNDFVNRRWVHLLRFTAVTKTWELNPRGSLHKIPTWEWVRRLVSTLGSPLQRTKSTNEWHKFESEFIGSETMIPQPYTKADTPRTFQTNLDVQQLVQRLIENVAEWPVGVSKISPTGGGGGVNITMQKGELVESLYLPGAKDISRAGKPDSKTGIFPTAAAHIVLNGQNRKLSRLKAENNARYWLDNWAEFMELLKAEIHEAK